MKRLLFALSFCSSVIAFAQPDTAPNEPPYTTLDEEFDQAEKAGGPPKDLRAGEATAVPSVPVEPKDSPNDPSPRSNAPVVAAPRASSGSSPQAGSATPTVPAPGASPEIIRKNVGGEQKNYIHHPLAKKGLRLIDRDGSYYFTANRTSKNDQTSTFRLGMVQPPPAITAADGVTTYSSMYGSNPPTILSYEYEWKPLRTFGELGVLMGFGFFTGQGHGRFVCTNGCPTQDGVMYDPEEKYTFYGVPLNAGVIYRFSYMDDQWVAPYVSAGGSYFALAEFRDDGKKPKLVGTPAVFGAGGLMFNFSALDRELGFRLDSEYNIRTMWLTLEARQIQATNKDLDVSGTMITVGVTADY